MRDGDSKHQKGKTRSALVFDDNSFTRFSECHRKNTSVIAPPTAVAVLSFATKTTVGRNRQGIAFPPTTFYLVTSLRSRAKFSRQLQRE